MVEWLAAGVVGLIAKRKIQQVGARRSVNEQMDILKNGGRLTGRVKFSAELTAQIQRALGQDECCYRDISRKEEWLVPCSGPLEVDHIKPVTQNGPNALSNFQMLCRAHNRSKGNDQPASYFRRMREKRDEALNAAQKKLEAKEKAANIRAFKKAQAASAGATSTRSSSSRATPKKKGFFGLF